MSDRFSKSFFGDKYTRFFRISSTPSKVDIFRNCGLVFMKMRIFFHFILLYCALPLQIKTGLHARIIQQFLSDLFRSVRFFLSIVFCNENDSFDDYMQYLICVVISFNRNVWIRSSFIFCVTSLVIFT